MWVVIGSGMLVLLIAAMGKQRKDNCKDYAIAIKGIRGEDFFLDESDILTLMKAATNGKIKGQPKTAFNLRKMEQLLEDNHWVKDAQLYFDNKDVLHVEVQEREPIARLFTSGGKSYYIDEDAMLMPLSDKLNARLPVFTGFTDHKTLKAADSTLLLDIVGVAKFINGDPFWTSQVAQIDINGEGSREFDMIPVVGNQVIKLGDGKHVEQKFNRLFQFYKQVLSVTGFGKYHSIDVRYAGQVVAAKSQNPRVDSVQLRKSVEKLLQQIKEAEKLMEEQSKLPTPAPAQPAPLQFDTASVRIDQPQQVSTTPTPPVPQAPKAVMPSRGNR